jgi:hypothetical protein
MGASIVRQGLQAGLLDELVISWSRWCWVAAPARWTVWSPGAPNLTWSGSSTPRASPT